MYVLKITITQALINKAIAAVKEAGVPQNDCPTCQALKSIYPEVVVGGLIGFGPKGLAVPQSRKSFSFTRSFDELMCGEISEAKTGTFELVVSAQTAMYLLETMPADNPHASVEWVPGLKGFALALACYLNPERWCYISTGGLIDYMARMAAVKNHFANRLILAA